MDLRYWGRGTHVGFRFDGDVDPGVPAVYFWVHDRLVALDLEEYTTRTLYEKSADQVGSHVAVTADGEYVCTAVRDDVAAEVDYVPTIGIPFDEYRSHEPYSRVLEVPVDGGDATVLHEGTYLSHVNASPIRPELLTFCHEGPWEAVHRIWGLNRETDEVWKIRPTAERARWPRVLAGRRRDRRLPRHYGRRNAPVRVRQVRRYRARRRHPHRITPLPQ
jgi:hypothetical protein